MGCEKVIIFLFLPLVFHLLDSYLKLLPIYQKELEARESE